VQLAEKRARLAAAIPPGYPGTLHFAAINLASLLAIAGCLAALQRPDPWMLAWAPGFFLFANLVEWAVHRGPMHQPRRGRLARTLYERHACQHHVMFTHERMEIASPAELKLVLFPWFVFPALLLATAPLPVALGLLLSPDHALLFLACAVAYYLVYEWLHTLHHWPQDTWIGRRRVMAFLRRHHTRHHDPALMTRGNWNVSFPLADWLLGSVLPARSPRQDPEDRPASTTTAT
jgi:hypothetical protein